MIWGLLWCAETSNFSLHFCPLHPAPAPEKISPKLIRELDINSLPLFLLIHESTFACYFYDLFRWKGVEYFLKVKIWNSLFCFAFHDFLQINLNAAWRSLVLEANIMSNWWFQEIWKTAKQLSVTHHGQRQTWELNTTDCFLKNGHLQ